MYGPTIRKFSLITKLLKSIDDVLHAQWINILSSLKKQKGLFSSCRKCVKNNGLTQEQYTAIMYFLNKYRERIIRINDLIAPEYYELTPLKEYEEELIANGQTLDDILNNILNEYNDFSVSEEEIFGPIAEEIINKASKNTAYIERLERYNQIRAIRVQKIQSDIKSKKLTKNLEIAEARLINLSRIVNHNINNNISGYRKFDFDKILKYKQQGEKLVKVIIACKVSGRSNASLYYVSKNETLTNSLCNALILGENECIPTVIQEMVDNHKIVVSEVLFPA
jgi:hypothetical protein